MDQKQEHLQEFFNRFTSYFNFVTELSLVLEHEPGFIGWAILRGITIQKQQLQFP